MTIGKASLALSWGFREEAFGSSTHATNRDRYPVILDYSGKSGLWRSSTVGEMTPDNKRVNLPENRHNEGINVLFHDGHGKWHSVEMFYDKITTGEYSKPLGCPIGVPARPTTELPHAIVGDDGLIRDAYGVPIATTH